MTQDTCSIIIPRGADADLIGRRAAFVAIERDRQAQEQTKNEIHLVAGQAWLMESIRATPAITPDGIKAKVEALVLWAPDMVEDNPNGSWEARMLISLLRDLTTI